MTMRARVAFAVVAASAASGGCQLLSGVSSLEIVDTGDAGATTTTAGSGGNGGTTAHGGSGGTTAHGGSGGTTTHAGGSGGTHAGGAGGATTSSCPGAAGAGGSTCGPGTAACTADGCTDLGQSADHCGACGVDCAGGTCAQGICSGVQLAGGQTDIQQVAASGDFAVWCTGDGDSVNAAQASAPDQIIPVVQIASFRPHTITTAGDHAFVGSFGPGQPIYRVRVGKNQQADRLVTPGDESSIPGTRSFALDGDDLYVAGHDSESPDGTGRVARVSTDPAHVTPVDLLVSGLSSTVGLAVEPGKVGYVYFTLVQSGEGRISRLKKGGKTAQTVIGSQGEVFDHLALADGTLYAASNQRVVAISTSDLHASDFAATKENTEIAVVGNYLYWSATDGVWRKRIRCGSAAAEHVAPGHPARGIGSNGVTAFWTVAGDEPASGVVFGHTYGP
jgi:hypothetical protein